MRELEAGYNSAVDAIKRKIILQSSEEQITELARQQLEFEGELNEKREEDIRLTKEAAEQSKNLAEIDKQRAKAGLKTSEEISNARENATQQIENETAALAEQGELIGQNASDYAGSLLTANLNQRDASEEALNNIAEEEKANAKLADGQIKNAKQVDGATRQLLNTKEQELANNKELQKLEDKNTGIQNEINKVISTQTELLNGLTKTKKKNTTEDEKVRTEYQKLTDAVKANEDALRKAITTNGDVDKATEDLTKSKEALRVVDDKLKEINDEYTKGLTNEKSALDVLTESTKKSLALENKRLDILDQLAAKGEDVATERLKQSLKIAQIELDLALKTAEASGIATDAQIANIQRLRGEVNLFQSSLEGEDNVSEKGFLQKTLFGTNEDGEPITGDDLLNGIATTLNATSELLGGFNALQNERLNTQLSVITT